MPPLTVSKSRYKAPVLQKSAVLNDTQAQDYRQQILIGALYLLILKNKLAPVMILKLTHIICISGMKNIFNLNNSIIYNFFKIIFGENIYI